MRLKRTIVMLIILTMVTSLFGCGDNTISNDKNDKPISMIDSVSKVVYPESVGFEDYNGKRSIWDNNKVSVEYLESINSFTDKVTYEILNKQERSKNIMYSPMSIFMALSLSASGANGKTQEEILSVLNMKDLGVEQLEEQTGNLFRLLYKDNEIGKLKLANSLWLDKDVSFKETYLDTAVNDYYAQMVTVDFSDKEKTEKLISNWISENTNGTLEGNNPVSEDQILSIINTIYFYDEWITKFNKDETKEDKFFTHDGKKVMCDFMNAEFMSSFIDGDGYISSSLGLKNDAAMNFYLPDKGVDVYDLISTEEKVDVLFNINNPELERKFGEVIFKVPKFNFGTSLKLKESLEIMGIDRAFKSGADFTGITNDIAFINDIIHESHISIDEKGCEASAYTQIDYCGSAPPKDKVEMILDRPFIFTITSSNGVVLFAGIVNNPTVK